VSARPGSGVLAAVAVGVVLAGCGGGAAATHPASSSLASGVSKRLIAAPRGSAFEYAVWSPKLRQLVMAEDAGPRLWNSHLMAVGLDRSSLTRLPISQAPGCRYFAETNPYALRNGRIAYIERCYGTSNRLPDEAVRLMAYDPRSRRTRPLRHYYLPFASGHFAFAPDSRFAVINDGNGLHEHLAAVGEEYLEPITLPLERAGNPAWSPGGRFIALDGVPKGIHAEGLDRLDLPRKLYLLEPRKWWLKPLVDGLAIGPSTPAWSPDGQWLAMTTKLQGRPGGVWLIEVKSGRVHRVLTGKDLGAPTWLPDGRTLIVPTGIDAIAYPEIAVGLDVGLYVLKLPLLGALKAA
jgi:hypothetical protein